MSCGVWCRRWLAGGLWILAGCSVDRSASPSSREPRLVPRGNAEVALRADGTLIPIWIGDAEPVSVCVSSRAKEDTTQWAMTWTIDGVQQPELRRPSLRSPHTACFELSAGLAAPRGTHTVCAELRDLYDQTLITDECLDLEIRDDDPTWKDLVAEMVAAPRAAEGTSGAEKVQRLLRVADDARRGGYLLTSLRATTIAIYVARNDPSEALGARALELSRTPPAWLDQPAATGGAALFHYERANVQLGVRRDDVAAWQELRVAEGSFNRTHHARRAIVALRQADILARAGALEEPVQRLESAIASCEEVPCDPRMLLSVRSGLAWAILLDQHATEPQLLRAETILGATLQDRTNFTDEAEEANAWLSLAYAQVRRFLPPTRALRLARAALSTIGPDLSPRAAELVAWGQIIAGLAALNAQQQEKARERCSAAENARSAEIAAWAASCVARSWADRHHWEQAAAAYRRALARHAAASSSRLAGSISLGTGRRAEDFYEAAQLELLRRRPAAAWKLLATLDELVATERPRITTDIAMALLDQEVRRLDAPASSAEGADALQKARAAREKLRDAIRLPPGTRQGSPNGERPTRAEFRAFAASGGTSVLRRHQDGTITVAKQATLTADRLWRLVESIETAVGNAGVDNQQWIRLTTPLSEALVPPIEELPNVVTLALHGVLQRVPWAALPVFDRAGTHRSWLGVEKAVAMVPGGISARPRDEKTVGSSRLFVVDPLGDIPSGNSSAAFYRAHNAGAVILARNEATRDAVLAAMRGSRSVAIDAHGRFDPAFPELSAIELADGPLRAIDLPEQTARIELISLVGCSTGRFPITADSGRFGLAGELARRGTAWTVGTAADLADDVAASFSRNFFDSSAEALATPERFRRALAALAVLLPASRWAPLQLFQGSFDPVQETERVPTPALSNSRAGSLLAHEP